MPNLLSDPLSAIASPLMGQPTQLEPTPQLEMPQPGGEAPPAQTGTQAPITVNLTLNYQGSGGGDEAAMRKMLEEMLEDGADLIERKLSELTSNNRRVSYS